MIHINIFYKFYNGNLYNTCILSISGGAGGEIDGHSKKNLTPKQIAQIQDILTKYVGPKLAKTLTQLLVSLVNGALCKVPLRNLLQPVVGFLVNLLKNNGTI